MSSILDALNRSDAERRRGQPPTLASPGPFAAPPRRRPAWLLPAVAGAALALAWWGGVFDSGGDGDAPALAEQPAGEAAPAAAPATQAPAPPLAAAPAAEPAAQAPGAAGPGGQADATPAAAAPGGDQVVTIFGPRRVAPADPAAPADGAGVAPPPADGMAPTAPVEPTAPASAPAPAPDAAEAEAAAAQALARALDRPPPPATPAAGADGSPPRLHELPFAVRRGLPALAVTMHLYSTDPARRFALVNGVRVTDGESLPGGVEVLAIRADGILVRFEGTEFVLPVRG